MGMLRVDLHDDDEEEEEEMLKTVEAKISVL